MREENVRPPRDIRLSPAATLAAERLAEIAGLSPTELLEIVLLELAASGAAVTSKRANIRSCGSRPAEVIPLELARRRGARRRRQSPATMPEQEASTAGEVPTAPPWDRSRAPAPQADG
jgi:hypothetical protein